MEEEEEDDENAVLVGDMVNNGKDNREDDDMEMGQESAEEEEEEEDESDLRATEKKTATEDEDDQGMLDMNKGEKPLKGREEGRLPEDTEQQPPPNGTREYRTLQEEVKSKKKYFALEYGNTTNFCPNF